MWETKHKSSPVIALSCEINSTHDEIPEEYIKQELAIGLSKELLKHNYIKVQKHKDVYSWSTTYKGSISIVDDTSISTVRVDDYIYTVRGIDISHNKIENAVINTYPELFL